MGAHSRAGTHHSRCAEAVARVAALDESLDRALFHRALKSTRLAQRRHFTGRPRRVAELAVL
jgi:hypothetical protein